MLVGFQLRHLVDAEGDHVGDQPHRGLGREGVGAAREVLLDDVVLGRARQLRALDPVLLGDGDVEAEQPGGGGVDRHRGVHLVERDPVEQLVHVALVGDRDADLADLAAGEDVVGVVAGLGRQVEGDREAGLALGQVAAVELVGAAGVGVAGVGAHHPGAVALGKSVVAHVPNDIWPTRATAEIRRSGRAGPHLSADPVFRLLSVPMRIAAVLLAASPRPCRARGRLAPARRWSASTATGWRSTAAAGAADQALRRHLHAAAAPTERCGSRSAKQTDACSYRTPVLGRDLEIAATERLLSGTPKALQQQGLPRRSSCAPAAAPSTSCWPIPLQRKAQLIKVTAAGPEFLAIAKT